MAQSHQEVDHVDIALIEGSINTTKQAEEVKKIREMADIVVAIGTCACFGGIQYLGEDKNTFEERMKKVYGQKGSIPKFTVGDPLPPAPLSKYIKVDYYIPGCPIAKENFVPLYTKLISGLKPQQYPYPVCTECKFKENNCLLTRGEFCAGPVTSAGCGAICPSHNLPCVGCFGPYEGANYQALIEKLVEIGIPKEEAIAKLRLYGGDVAEKKIKGE